MALLSRASCAVPPPPPLWRLPTSPAVRCVPF